MPQHPNEDPQQLRRTLDAASLLMSHHYESEARQLLLLHLTTSPSESEQWTQLPTSALFDELSSRYDQYCLQSHQAPVLPQKRWLLALVLGIVCLYGSYALLNPQVEKGTEGRFYWKTPNQANFLEVQSAEFDVVVDGRFHNYTLPLDNLTALNSLRLDPSAWAVDTLLLESILFKKEGVLVQKFSTDDFLEPDDSSSLSPKECWAWTPHQQKNLEQMIEVFPEYVISQMKQLQGMVAFSSLDLEKALKKHLPLLEPRLLQQLSSLTTHTCFSGDTEDPHLQWHFPKLIIADHVQLQFALHRQKPFLQWLLGI